jgi:hypothetical protein
MKSCSNTAQAVRRPHKIRYSEQEWQTIRERASISRQPPARYVRTVSLGAQPRVVRSQLNADAVHELGQIGNSLLGLRKEAHSVGLDDRARAIDAVLTELFLAVKRLG